MINRSRYLAFNSLSNFCGGINYALSTHSMLNSLSIDNEVMTLSTGFILKDVIGQLGTVTFAYSKKSVDKSPRKFGNKMNILNQFCFFLENLTPFFPQFFLPIAGLSNLGKNMSMIGIGSVNVKCMNKLKNKDELGDSYSKITAQNSVSSSLGMATGVFITTILPSHEERLCFVFPIVSIIQLWSFNKAISFVYDWWEIKENFFIII